MRMTRGVVAGVMMCTVMSAGLAGAAVSAAAQAPAAAPLAWHRYHVPVTGQATHFARCLRLDLQFALWAGYGLEVVSRVAQPEQ